MAVTTLDEKTGLETPPLPATPRTDYFFLLLAVGEALKINSVISARHVQEVMVKENFLPSRIRFPLEDCRLALTMMENSGFIIKSDSGEGEYARAR